MSGTEIQKTEPSDEKKAKSPEIRRRVVIRDLKKGIFFYPIAIFSFIAALIAHIGESNNPTLPWVYSNVLSIIWIVIFFANVYVVSFDFSAGKFIAMIFVVAAIMLIMFLLMQSGVILPGDPFVFNLLLRTQFFWMMAAILGGVVLLTLIISRFRYVRIEPNEVLIKGILGDVKRFPTANMRYDKRYDDVFEYFALRAGSLTLYLDGKDGPVILHTVANMNKKALQMDALLSKIKIKIGN